jgi:membrane fusion protein (multidrug efflux system)
MKKNKYCFILLAIALAGCSERENNQQKKNVSTAFNVQVEKVSVYGGGYSVSYSGMVEARQTTPLSFSTMGTVTQIFVEEGQYVRKGQLLAKLNASTAENTYQLALQKQQQAEDAYNRLKPMKENGTFPEIKWVEIETGLNQAKAATAIAKKGIADGNLYAVADGVIGKKNIMTGVNVLPGMTAFDLLDIQKVYVKIPVPENEISSFKKGASATIHIAAISLTISGTVREIGVSADILSHTYPVKIELQNSKGNIKPGMVCAVTISSEANASGFLISNKALQKDVQGNQFLYVTDNNTAQKREVKTIALIGQKVLVAGNLKEGDEVIVSGQDKLQPGSSINIIR